MELAFVKEVFANRKTLSTKSVGNRRSICSNRKGGPIVPIYLIMDE